MTYVVRGIPIPKPRMTQRDKWANRECVLKYWDWKARVQQVSPPAGYRQCIEAVFYLPIPKSLRKKVTPGQAHRSKPDLDNLLKALSDALVLHDESVHTATVSKYYDDGRGPRVEFSIC